MWDDNRQHCFFWIGRRANALRDWVLPLVSVVVGGFAIVLSLSTEAHLRRFAHETGESLADIHRDVLRDWKSNAGTTADTADARSRQVAAALLRSSLTYRLGGMRDLSVFYLHEALKTDSLYANARAVLGLTLAEAGLVLKDRQNWEQAAEVFGEAERMYEEALAQPSAMTQEERAQVEGWLVQTRWHLANPELRKP